MKKLLTIFLLLLMVYKLDAGVDFVAKINTDATNLTTLQKTELLDDFCKALGYQETITDSEGNLITNPQSKKDFANEKIAWWIKIVINSYRRTNKEKQVTYEVLEF